MRAMRPSPLLGASFFVCLATPAVAHHPTGGRIPATFLEGLVSGLAHPMLGPDHFLAIMAVGLLSLGLARGGWLAAMFVASGLLGTGLHLARLDVPAAEVLIAGTVVLFGMLVLASRAPQRRATLAWLAPIAISAGTLHGYAYGESIVGAGASPLVAYLLGFCVIQTCLVLAVRRCARWISDRGVSSAARLRTISGAVVSLAGIVLVVVALSQ
jgi:urease accessory protein